MTVAADDLIPFAQVVACGSFTGAARRTGMPKSTVSRRMATLEASLGERLLIRGTRALRLTEFGEAILHHGQRMLDDVSAVADTAQHRQVTPSGQLRVSLPPEFQELSLLPLVRAYTARYPQVRLELDVSPHPVDLMAGRFDLAVRVARQAPDDGTLVARPLTELPHGLYASPTYLARHGEPGTPADLNQHVGLTLIGSNGEPQPWALRCGDDCHTVMPVGPVAANSISLQSALAVGGAGIFGLSERFAAPIVGDGLLRRVLPKWQQPTFTAWAVTHGRRLLPFSPRRSDLAEAGSMRQAPAANARSTSVAKAVAVALR